MTWNHRTRRLIHSLSVASMGGWAARYHNSLGETPPARDIIRQMPLKIMCAGCPKDEREPAEAAVKAALGQVAGSWTVSLVKMGRQWSLTVDGPDVKHKTT